jgi:hypothetical protein
VTGRGSEGTGGESQGGEGRGDKTFQKLPRH